MKDLILGSSSPRRKQLLESLGFDFCIRTKETDESFPSELHVREVAEYVAWKKANALISEINNNEVLICADTVVVLGDEILGKPIDREDAISMLSRLSNQKHEVITGVVCYSKERNRSFSTSTYVHFNRLLKEEISFYVDTYQPFDKAGSYGIQDWIGCVGIQRIEGSYTNVVGLPTQEVYTELSKWEIKKVR